MIKQHISEVDVPQLARSLPPPSLEESKAAVSRILASASFSKANRLFAFLEYVCRLTLDGREGEINEINIGMKVFERRESYNASDDTIVRTTARLLRQRLQAYYETEGRFDRTRIEIPRGTYVPTFFTVIAESDTPLPLPLPALPSPPEPGRDRGVSAAFIPSGPLFVVWLLAAAALGAVMAFLLIAPHRLFPQKLTPSDKLWAILFPPDRNVLLVPADTILLMYEAKNHRQVSLDDYIGGNFADTPDDSVPWMRDYRTKRYTAVTSVEMAAEFGRIPKLAPERLQVRFARDLQTAELRQSNAILIGAAMNNPWVTLFRKELDFHIDWDAAQDRWHVVDDHPAAGQPAEWSPLKDDPAHPSYSQIALVHNLSGNGYVLILAGTNMFGSQAASDFVFNPLKMNPLLKQALRNDGTLGTFEILLQSNVVGNGTINASVAAVRIHRQ